MAITRAQLSVDLSSPSIVNAPWKIVAATATSGTAVQAAITALGAMGGTVLLMPGTHTWDTVPGLPPALTGRLRIMGAPGTVIQLTSTGKRAFDFAKGADHDVFQHLELCDFAVDCNNVAGATAGEHVILGTIQAGTIQTRIQVKRLAIRRVRAYNIPTDHSGATSHRLGIWICVKHAADNEGTTDVLEDILCEDVRIEGGSQGFFVGATSPGNSASVRYARVRFVRCYHDTLVTPTAAVATNGAANFFIGSAAYGEDAWVLDCYGANSNDVGIEIDGCTTGGAVGTTIVDSRNAEFFTRNFHVPELPSAQRIIWSRCHAKVVNAAPASGGISCQGFLLGYADATATPVEHIVIDHCTFYSGATAGTVNGAAIDATDTMVRRITITGFQADLEGLTGASGTARIVQIYPHIDSTVVIDNPRIRVAGTLPGGSTYVPTGIMVGPNNTNLRFSIRNPRFDFGSLTNVGTGNTIAIQVGISGQTGTVKGSSISGFAWSTLTSDPQPKGIQTRGTADFPITELKVVDCDFTNAAGGAVAADILPGSGNEKNIRPRGNTHRAALPPVGVGITTGAYVLQNLLPYDVEWIISGGSGTVITLTSREAGSSAENILSQAEGAFPYTRVVVRVGDTLGITNTVAPASSLVRRIPRP